MANNREYAHESFAQSGSDADLAHPVLTALTTALNIAYDGRDLFCKFRLDGTLTFVNQAYGEYFQKTPATLIGSNILDLVPPDARGSIAQQLRALKQLTADHPAVIQEHEVLAADGSIRWHQWINLALFDAQGQITELQAVGHDITARKTIEQAVKESEQLLNLFFSQSLDGFFFAMLDQPLAWSTAVDKAPLLDYAFHHLRITRTNQAFLDQYLARQAEMQGRSFADFFADEPIIGKQILRQLFDNGHLHIEIQKQRLDGTPILIEGDYICLYDDEGRITGNFGIQRDITDITSAVNALAESEAKYRLLVENQTELVVKIDPNNRFLFASPSYCKLFGKSMQDLLGTTFTPLVHEANQAVTQTMMARLFAPPYSCYLEQQVMTVHGWRWLAWSNQAVLNQAGEIEAIVGVGRDITERKRAELKLQESEARFRNVTTNLPGAVFRYLLHPDGSDHVAFMNQGCLDIWEVDPALVQESAAPLWAMVQPEERQQIWRLVEQSAETLQPWSYEFRITTPNGKLKWLQGMGRPERRTNGDVVWDILVLDASDRKQAERALTETGQQLQSFLDNTPAIVCLFDATGRYLKVNQAGAEVFGLAPAALTGKTFAELLSPEIVATFMGRIEQLVATQVPMVVEDRLPLHGAEKICQTILFPVTTNGSGPIIMGSIATDITPMVEAQATLQRQAEEERLIRSMTQRIRESLDLQQILQTTVNEIRSFLQTDRVLVYRFNDDWSGDMIVESVAAPWISVLGTTIKDPCFQAPLIQQYLQGRIGRIDNIHQANMPTCYKDLLAQFQVQANLTIPINCRGELWGLLCVHHCQAPRPWQEDEIRLLRQISDQVAIALYQSQLLSESKARAAQEKLLNNIVTAISGSLELTEVLQRATDEMVNTFQASRGLIILCHPETQQRALMTTTAAANVDDLRDMAIPINDNPIAQMVFGQDAPVAINDTDQHHGLESLRSILAEIKTRAILAVAIRYRGEFKGILGLHQCHAPRRWSPEEKRLIKRVADHLAIAIQQAELYQQAQDELAERKRLEAQLRYEAFHDRLTTLPNRAFFLEQLSQVLERLQQNCRKLAREDCYLWQEPNDQACCPYQFAVLFLDLNRFKIINDSLGHTVGDTLLQIVAQRLQNCLGQNHMAARLGGDEFVVLLSQLHTVSEATELALAIHTVLEAPILIQQYEVFIRASIGIALSSPEYTDPSQLLRDADIAMYQAKDGNCEYAIFDAPMHTLAVQQMQLENDLRHAIERQEFELYYQPIVYLRNGQLQGFEALIRWRHPSRGMVSPADFIPVAENTDLIAVIDLWTLNQACLQMRQWHQQFPQHQDLTINVNLSGKQFVRPDLIQRIDQVLAATGLQGNHLKLEITESVLIQNAPLAIDILNQLQQRHIKVCMDDFGTGYSSLSYLHRFPVDILKIDKSFISSLQTEDGHSGDCEIIRAIISLANSLNLSVVAEGIETAEQLNYLQANHCHGGQGYYYSRPMAAADVGAYLKE